MLISLDPGLDPLFPRFHVFVLFTVLLLLLSYLLEYILPYSQKECTRGKIIVLGYLKMYFFPHLHVHN